MDFSLPWSGKNTSTEKFCTLSVPGKLREATDIILEAAHQWEERSFLLIMDTLVTLINILFLCPLLKHIPSVQKQ